MKKLLLSVAILFVVTFWLSHDNNTSDVKENDIAELVNNNKIKPIKLN